MAEIEAVTSFNERLYGLSSKVMLDSYENNLSDEFSLHVYFEGANPPTGNHTRVKWERYTDPKSMASFRKFAQAKQAPLVKKQANGRYVNGNTFRFDAIRFSWKGFALADHALKKSDARYFMWLDADSQANEAIDAEWVKSFLKEGDLCAYLNRTQLETETGFLLFDRQHPGYRTFWLYYKNLYHKKRIFNHQKWLDGYAFDLSRIHAESQGITFTGINDFTSPHSHMHPWLASRLSERTMHFKGPSLKKEWTGKEHGE